MCLLPSINKCLKVTIESSLFFKFQVHSAFLQGKLYVGVKRSYSVTGHCRGGGDHGGGGFMGSPRESAF